MFTDIEIKQWPSQLRQQGAETFVQKLRAQLISRSDTSIDKAKDAIDLLNILLLADEHKSFMRAIRSDLVRLETGERVTTPELNSLEKEVQELTHKFDAAKRNDPKRAKLQKDLADLTEQHSQLVADLERILEARRRLEADDGSP